MRIASLVPSATEMLFALGLGDRVVAVTHECDYPPSARSLPHLTRSVLPAGLGPADVDRQVKARVAEGRPLYELDEELLAELAPDLIVTQALCEVCAVSFDDVVAVAARLPSKPRVIQQDPSTLNEMLDDVVALAEAPASPTRATSCGASSRAGSRSCARPWLGRRRHGWSRSSGSTRPSSPVTGCRR